MFFSYYVLHLCDVCVIIYTEVKERPHRERMLYMTKEIYIKEAKNHLRYAHELKEDGKFTFTIKMHFLSKLDGIGGIATNDKELTVEDYKEIADEYYKIKNMIWDILSDAEPEIEL